jgi:hypothetical protein
MTVERIVDFTSVALERIVLIAAPEIHVPTAATKRVTASAMMD